MAEREQNINKIITNAHKPAKLSVTLDHALYERYLDESDLTEDQKQEFLQTLWNIIVSFVDLGFEVHPVQQTGNLEEADALTDRDSHGHENLLSQCDGKHQPETLADLEMEAIDHDGT